MCNYVEITTGGIKVTMKTEEYLLNPSVPRGLQKQKNRTHYCVTVLLC
jgi:hypothetical protein